MNCRRILLSLAVSCVTILSASADGPPWDSKTQEVLCDTLRVRISEEQRTQLERTGEVELSDRQLALIREFYPKAVKTQFAHIATASDNMGGEEEPYLVWTSPDELSVTLLDEFLKNEEKRKTALTHEGPIYTPAHPVARITVSGRIYLDGKRIELPELLKLLHEKTLSSFAVAPPCRGGGAGYHSDDTPGSETYSNWEERRAAILLAVHELAEREHLNCWQEF